MLKHIVMWKLKDPTEVPRFKAELESCRGIVPGMHDFEVATRQDGLQATHDVALYSVFDDAAALQAYIVHPRHKEVVAVVSQLAESRSAFDYIA
jgi:quinol monooxygenase YgiN